MTRDTCYCGQAIDGPATRRWGEGVCSDEHGAEIETLRASLHADRAAERAWAAACLASETSEPYPISWAVDKYDRDDRYEDPLGPGVPIGPRDDGQ